MEFDNKPTKCGHTTMSDKAENAGLDVQAFGEQKLEKPALLLHSCCGPCSTSVVSDLIHSYKITIFFYNPNITDKIEYNKRLESQKKFIEDYNNRVDCVDIIEFIEGDYEPKQFAKVILGLENEPEGGQRCKKCFFMRLEKTAATVVLAGFECFATTLSVSPHKNYNVLSETGHDLSARYGIGFIDKDYKKNGGYQRSIELSREYGLYRQGYCGCEFSHL